MMSFSDMLAVAIKAEIRKLRRDGVTGMGLENLKQVVRLPKEAYDAGPKGTNAQFAYAAAFRDVCCNDPTIRKFVTDDLGLPAYR